MSQHARVRWLVTYDIADPRRLSRMFRALKKEGIPIQYSVFYVCASQQQMGSLMARLAHLIHPRQDDVRAYRIPEKPLQITLGRSILPEDTLQDPSNPFLIT